MSQADVEIVRRFGDAVERMVAEYWDERRSFVDRVDRGVQGDAFAEARAITAEDAVWVVGALGTFTGAREIAGAWDETVTFAADYRVELTELVDCGDGRVMAVIDRTVTVSAGGVHTTIPVYCVVTVADGMVARIDEHLTRREALQAASPRSGRAQP
jgi:hypothetical protein